MYFLSTISVKKFCGFSQLRSTYNRVINHQKTLIFDQSVYRNQFHSCNQISLALLTWHKRSWPGRCILNKWTCKRYTGPICIADCMSNTGIRYTCNKIRINLSGISSCQNISAFIAHFLYVNPFIGRGRIAIVYPKEGADSHFVSWLLQYLHTLRCNKIDFSRS